MFFSRLSVKATAEFCRAVGTCLRGGLGTVDALRIVSERSRQPIRGVATRLLEEVRAGEDLTTAVKQNSDVFPMLFVVLVDVSCRTGHLPEALVEMEKYFRFLVRLRRRFYSQIAWPVFQLIAAILVIALLIYILGIIASVRGGEVVDILGLGLTGERGAMVWLGACFGSAAALAIAFLLLRKAFWSTGLVDRILIRIPILGPCLRTLALSRLCFAMRLTLDSGMPIHEAMSLSLSATDNGAFTSLRPEVDRRLRSGENLHAVLADRSVFPAEFLEVLATSEESGSVPEAMGRLSEQYNEQVEFQLALLNEAVGWCVWLTVAAIIIFFIFRIFMNYVKLLNQFIPRA